MEGMGQKMQWMYDGTSSKIDQEDYLLGKKITKLVDENESFMGREGTNSGLDVTVLEKLDYDNKVREDPLFAIKQKEYEHRKEVLSNPVKKKKIQSLLKNALEKDLKGKGLHKKHKKKKKHKKYSSSSESDSESSDDELTQKMKDKKLRKLLKAQLKSDLHKDKSSSEETDEGKSRHKVRKRSSEHNIYSSSDRNTSKKHRTKSPDKHIKGHKKSRSTSSSSERDKSSSPHNQSRKYGLIAKNNSSKMTDEERARLRRLRRKTPSPVKDDTKYKRKHAQGFTKKLNKKDLEKRRLEMMNSADIRNDQRRKNVDRYNKEEENELKREKRIRDMQKDEEDKYGVKSNDFVHAMKLKNASGGSLSDTVRRKKHTLTGKL